MKVYILNFLGYFLMVIWQRKYAVAKLETCIRESSRDDIPVFSSCFALTSVNVDHACDGFMSKINTVKINFELFRILSNGNMAAKICSGKKLETCIKESSRDDIPVFNSCFSLTSVNVDHSCDGFMSKINKTSLFLFLSCFYLIWDDCILYMYVYVLCY